MNDTLHIITPNDTKLIINDNNSNLITTISANSNAISINNYTHYGDMLLPIGEVNNEKNHKIF